MMFGNIFGVFAIENSDIYLFELETHSSRAESLPLLVFSYLLLVIVIYFLDAKIPFNAKNSLVNKSSDVVLHFGGKFYVHFDYLKLLAWVCLFLSLVLFIKVLPYPYFSLHVDRFLYKEYYLPSFFGKLDRVIMYCLPFLFLLIVHKKDRCAILTVILYTLYSFWIGEKFGAYWFMLVNGCIVYSIEGEKLPTFKLRKYLFTIFMIVCALMMVLFFHRYLNRFSNFTGYFYQRVAQQGQLYWSVYQKENQKQAGINRPESEVDTFYRLDDKVENRYDHGIYKIMKLTTPLPRFWRKIDSKSRYTASTYASIYYYFKEIGMVGFSICIGCLYWFFLRLLLMSIDELHFIDTLIGIKIFNVLALVLGMSEFNALFSYKFTLVVLLLLGIMLARHSFNRLLVKEHA